jgi:FtsH-binding integral membrane protein
VLSDVGLIGVVALLAWVVAYCWWLWRPARDGSGPAWLVLAVLAVSVVDWLSRTTLGSYPTGFTTLYLLGLATAATLAVRPDRVRALTREALA